MKKKELEKGFSCECGTFHSFDPYVYAHWRDELVHTCTNCGSRHLIRNGKAAVVK